MDALLLFLSTHWLSLLGACLSLIWVALEYRASMWLWPVGVILPLFYIAISWEASFIGNIGINVYYLIASILGWWAWIRGRGQAEKPITRASRRSLRLGIVLGLVLTPLVFLLLRPYSVLPLVDAISTSASVLGMILLGRKHLEHWICWMIANASGAVVFGAAEDYISLFVFVVNLLMSFLGYHHWQKLMQAQAQEA